MDQVKIGKFISKQRKLKELTQEELATKMGVSTNAVSKWERGLNLPDASIMQDLCKELDISLNELFAGTEISEKDIAQQSEATLLDVFRDSALKISKMRMKIIVFAVIITLLIFSMGKSYLVNNGVLMDDNLRYTQMYYSGEGNIKGDVDTKRLGHASIDFDIGANKYGLAVFKNPNAAYNRIKKDYKKELKTIADEFDLGPLSFLTFRHYATFGPQLTVGTPEEKERAFFVAVVLGLYCNSFNDLPTDSGIISRIFN